MAVLNFYHLKDGKLPENAVYIGRAQPSKGLTGSIFANPFRLQDHDNDRDKVIKLYQRWLWDQLQMGRVTQEQLLDLVGKDLVCFCAPKACHGDVVERAIKWAQHQRNNNANSRAPQKTHEEGETASKRNTFKPDIG